MKFQVPFFVLLYNYIVHCVFLIPLHLKLLYLPLLVLSLNYFLKTFYSFHLAQNIYLHCLVCLLPSNCFVLLSPLFALYFQNLLEETIHVQLNLQEFAIIHNFDPFSLHLTFSKPIFYIFHYTLFQHNDLLQYNCNQVLLLFHTLRQILNTYYIQYKDLVFCSLHNS